MAKGNRDLADVLKVEGVNAEGFGTIGKLAMKDPRLSIESKAIYSYFCSYAGSGDTAFPKVTKIIYDLNISKDRYYKHFKPLVKLGYITVKQEKNDQGKFLRNIYTLVSKPSPYFKDTETEKPSPYFPDTGNKDIIINNSTISFKNTNTKKVNQSVSNREGGSNKVYSMTDRTGFNKNLLNQVKLNICFEEMDIKDQRIIEPAIIGLLAGDYDNKIPRSVVMSVLEKIDYFAVERAIQSYRQVTAENIMKPIAYFQRCLITATSENELEVDRFTYGFQKKI